MFIYGHKIRLEVNITFFEKYEIKKSKRANFGNGGQKYHLHCH